MPPKLPSEASKPKAFRFLKSAITVDNPFMSLAQFMSWLDERKNFCHNFIEPIRFSEMSHWGFDHITSNLVHDSGKFFTIEGVLITTNWGKVSQWSQPIINQPEIGFLGIVAKEFNGILYFLMQAKIEPGNINHVQLSPTLQATKSNYTQAHKGHAPLYLEYFLGQRSDTVVLLDQLQSEQGARFLKKRNRNIIIEVLGDVEIKEDFCWLSLGQIKKLMTYDNIVNMDTRTVFSGVPFGDLSDTGTQRKVLDQLVKGYNKDLLLSELDTDHALHSLDDIISWITRLKSFAELEVKSIPLKEVSKWQRDEHSISHEDRKYFSVIAVRVEIGNREVSSWTQPLVKPAQEGIVAFIIKKINGVYHFLVQAKLEVGNFDIVELAPTVQCLTGNYRKGLKEYEPAYLEEVLNAELKQTGLRYSTLLSEEGGRFYREQNKNIIVEVGADFPERLPEQFMWMTLNQLKAFLKFNNYLNIQARSLISTISFI